MLEPEPQSVGRARTWVVDQLRGLGRDDLADAAELGVSELVTNAILHATPPITVRVAGTRTHPRVEVADKSLRPPAVNVEMAEEDMLLSTVGRGLGLVALYSATWGAEVSSAGKVVWFEPMHDTHPRDELAHGSLAGDVFDLDQVVAARLAGSSEPGRRPTIVVR
ncbi:MAG: ATP-binding protein, partial [Nocardioidaceae bacterium]